MIDEMDWDWDLGPTHILNKNYNFLPVHISRDVFDVDEDEDVNYCVISISDNNYSMIDHKKPYIFLHIIDGGPSFDNLSREVREHIDEMLKIVIKDVKCMSRQHTHIWGGGGI